MKVLIVGNPNIGTSTLSKSISQIISDHFKNCVNDNKPLTSNLNLQQVTMNDESILVDKRLKYKVNEVNDDHPFKKFF